MAPIRGKPGRAGQIQSLNLSTPRGALQVPAAPNKGEVRRMGLDGAANAPSPLRFLGRLVREAGRKVLLTHHVRILEMNGESYRLAQSKRCPRAVSSAADIRP